MAQFDETTAISSSQSNAQIKKKYTKGEINKLIESDSTTVTLVSPTTNQRSSKCWSSFKLVFVGGVPQDFAMCNECKTLIVYKNSTGTGGLQKHLDSCMKRTVGRDQSTLDEFLVTNTSSPSSRNAQFNRVPCLPKSWRRSLNRSFVEFVALDCRSFETIRGVGFDRLIKHVFRAGQSTRSNSINTNALIPSAKTVC